MPPPKTEDESLVLKGSTSARMCPYREYHNPLDLSQYKVGEKPHIATCGFNQDALFYCPPQQGDAPVVTL